MRRRTKSASSGEGFHYVQLEDGSLIEISTFQSAREALRWMESSNLLSAYAGEKVLDLSRSVSPASGFLH